MPSILSLPRDAWRLARPFFNSERRWPARIKLAGLVAMTLSLVAMDVMLSFWNRAFFNALQTKDAGAYTDLLITYHRLPKPDIFLGFIHITVLPGFIEIAFVYILVAIYLTYLRQWLEIDWRQWMTTHLLSDWLADRAYYRISLMSSTGADEGSDNPDQRIAEDLQGYISQTLLLSLDLLSNVVTLFSFISILWALSGPIVLLGVHIPGYMVWVALLYSIVGTALTHLVGRPLIALNFRRQKVEADFRFSLVRLRENVEAIALYRGEALENEGLAVQFAALRANWWDIMRRTKLLGMFVNGFNQFSTIFPFVVAAPRFFSGALDLGSLTQTAGAFSSVQGAMSWLVTSYRPVAELRATIDRLDYFRAAVDAARAANADQRHPPEAADYHLDHPSLRLPNGKLLIEDAGVTLQRGRSAAFSGRSGSGKSTLFRALAGIWPFGHSGLQRGAGTSLFLPQRPYFPLGTLRRAVCYPGNAAGIDDQTLHQALDDVGLGHLVPELDQRDRWAQRLSGGEQQRLAIARALVARPDWLFMDEGTASLDPASEQALLALLRLRLPETTIVSITHRPDVAALHAVQYTVTRDGDGPGRIAAA